jgi:hypothetical protein
LFWTVPLKEPNSVEVHMGAGKARMTMTHLALNDFFNIPNALFRFQDPLSAPASATFDIQWSGPVTNRAPVSSPPGSSGELVMSQATIPGRRRTRSVSNSSQIRRERRALSRSWAM